MVRSISFILAFLVLGSFTIALGRQSDQEEKDHEPKGDELHWQMAKVDSASLLIIQMTDARKELKSWRWIGRLEQNADGQTFKLVELDSQSLKPKSKVFEQFEQRKNRIQFVSHELRTIVEYQFDSVENAERAMRWCVPEEWLDRSNRKNDREMLGSFSRLDGRVSTVHSTFPPSKEQPEIRGIKLSAFANKPKPGDIPLVKEFLVVPFADEFLKEAEGVLTQAPPDSTNYKTFQAFLSKP
jgi:hypothetical protein